MFASRHKMHRGDVSTVKHETRVDALYSLGARSKADTGKRTCSSRGNIAVTAERAN